MNRDNSSKSSFDKLKIKQIKICKRRYDVHGRCVATLLVIVLFVLLLVIFLIVLPLINFIESNTRKFPSNYNNEGIPMNGYLQYPIVNNDGLDGIVYNYGLSSNNTNAQYLTLGQESNYTLIFSADFKKKSEQFRSVTSTQTTHNDNIEKIETSNKLNLVYFQYQIPINGVYIELNSTQINYKFGLDSKIDIISPVLTFSNFLDNSYEIMGIELKKDNGVANYQLYRNRKIYKSWTQIENLGSDNVYFFIVLDSIDNQTHSHVNLQYLRLYSKS